MVVKLTNVRIAFCQDLFKMGSVNADDKPAFSSTFLIPQNDAQLGVIDKVIKKVSEEKWDKKAEAILKTLKGADKICVHDGGLKDLYDGFEGNMYISARTYVAPSVFDKDKTKLDETTGKPYAGCYVNALVDIYAQDNKYGKRINASLKGVQFLRDGYAFAGTTPASADDFDDVSDIGELDESLF